MTRTKLVAMFATLVAALSIGAALTGTANASMIAGGTGPSAQPTSSTSCVPGPVTLKGTVKGNHKVVASDGQAVFHYTHSLGCRKFLGKIHVNLIRSDLKAWGGPKNGVGRANKLFTVSWNDSNPGSMSISLPKAQIVGGECLNAFQADVVNLRTHKIIATTRELIPGAEAGCKTTPKPKPTPKPAPKPKPVIGTPVSLVNTPPVAVLPHTGGNPFQIAGSLALAALLFIGGTVLVIFGRRRPQGSTI
jgi:hypothetical protein